MAKKTKTKKQNPYWKYFSILDQKLRALPKNVIFALVFFAACICLLNYEDFKINQKVLGIQTQIKAEQQTIYDWEQIVRERPGYRDGWLQLSALYLKTGDKIKAKSALSQAKIIDPNNENIISLEKLLEN